MAQLCGYFRYPSGLAVLLFRIKKSHVQLNYTQFGNELGLVNTVLGLYLAQLPRATSLGKFLVEIYRSTFLIATSIEVNGLRCADAYFCGD